MSDAYSLGLTFPTDGLNDAVSDLELLNINTSDLLSLAPAEISKRANIPISTVEQVRLHAISQLHAGIGYSQPLQTPVSIEAISTLDPTLDGLLGGGFRPGFVSEIVGPSGAGKTQWLLSLLLATQLPPPHGISRPSLYISTEHPLPTQRLSELLTNNPVLKAASPKPTLGRILTLNASELEVQDHILNFQLPVVLERHNIGAVIIDSITANYRGEAIKGQNEARNQGKVLSDRSAELIKLGALLRSLALKYNCAIICANQVSDVLDPVAKVMQAEFQAFISSPDQGPGPSSFQALGSSPGQYEQDFGSVPDSVMSLDHQQKWFTGWGDSRPGRDGARRVVGASAKVPALGLIWSNQIACRVAVYKSTESASKRAHTDGIDTSVADAAGLGGADWAPKRFRRWARLVFSPWGEASAEDDVGVEFEVWSGGLRAMRSLEEDA